MKKKCTECGVEHNSIYGFGKCYKCKDKQAVWLFVGSIVFVALFFAVIFGVRVIWANIVFDDWRCALSECRIIKE